jgi:hypothetical protein
MFKFDSFNLHHFHPQVHSSSEKFVHLNHLFHLHFAFVKQLHLFLNHLHLFSVKDHQYHQLQLHHKLLYAILLLSPFHHDQSSLNVFQLLQLVHVISSLNVGFHMEHKLNEKPLFNVLLLLNNMLLHAMLSFNMKLLKFVLFVNSNVLVLLKKTHKLISNVMEQLF